MSISLQSPPPDLVGHARRHEHVVFLDAASPRAPFISSPTTVPTVEEIGCEQNAFVRWLLGQAGIDAEIYGAATLARRLPACLRGLRVNSTERAQQKLQRDPSLLPRALSSLLIGVTSFFRDTSVFKDLEDTVLPQLLRRRGNQNPRIWSVGCSDGAELYSVAMLLAEQGRLGCCELFGTDCRADAVAAALLGCYEQTAIKTVPHRLLNQYFVLEGGWRVIPPLRQAAHWRTADVLADPQDGEFDLILCRNLAIYLKPQAAARLWQTLGGRLRRGGVLVTGKAERPMGAHLEPLAPCIWQNGSQVHA